MPLQQSWRVREILMSISISYLETITTRATGLSTERQKIASSSSFLT